MEKKTLFAIREFIIIFLSGGIPVLLSYKLGGLKELEKIVGGLIPTDLFLYYCTVMAIIFLLLYSLEKYIYINPLSSAKTVLNFTISTFHELSTNLLGLFRLACGLMLSYPLLVFIIEFESFNKVFLKMFPLGVLGWVEVTIFYWWFSKLKLKQGFQINHKLIS